MPPCTSEVILPVGFPATFEAGEIAPRTDSFPHILDAIVVKDYRVASPARVWSGWSSRKLLDLYIKNGCVPIQDNEGKVTRFALTETGAIYGYKKRAADQGHVLSVIRNVGTTKQNSIMLEGWGLKFDYPKPLMLMRYLCQIGAPRGGLVLDFFAGSATTAHAVLEQSREDGYERRFIMVQLPEPAREGNRPTIAEIAKERIGRAIDKLKQESGLRPPPSSDDLGVRVFKLTESHMRPWRGIITPTAQEYAAQLALFNVQLGTDAEVSNIIWEVALKEGFPLTAQIVPVAGVTTNAVQQVFAPGEDRSFFICLDARLDDAILDALPLSKTDLFVCRDSALSDTLAANLAQQCELRTL